MTQRWGHADVRLFKATADADAPRFVAAYAEVRRGCRTESFRSLGRGEWCRVAETADDLRAAHFTRVTEAQPDAFAQLDPEAVPRLRHLLEQVELARRIATEAHAGRTDAAGRPRIDHARRVAGRLADLESQAVAWLRAVLEETVVTAADLREAGIDDVIADAALRSPRRERTTTTRRATSAQEEER